MLSQHIGAPCEAKVAKRDKVTAGQVIGSSDAFVSAPVHSPITGTVKDISLQSHPVVGRAMAITIEADPEAENIQIPANKRFDAGFDETQYSAEQILNAINEAGVIGMGGAGFPTRVKIQPNEKMPKTVLIINACECEPFITCDYRMMLEWTYQMIAGIKLANRVTECPEVYIGIEDNKPKAIEAVTEAVKSCKGTDNWQVCALKTQYPQGGEKQLIKAIIDKDVPVGGIPPMIGVAVLNVATCAAIAEAVVLNRPLTYRVVTVTGRGISNRGNFYVPVGTTVADMVEFCGGMTSHCAKIIMGGPMMGSAISDLTTPLTKTSGSLIFLTKEDITKAKHHRQQTPCIRCGRCLDVCPANINPTKISHAVQHEMLDVAENYHIGSCIECGCCSYICPANIEITGYIKTGKVLMARAKKKMS
jgi:electron transport complex protein RnfC